MRGNGESGWRCHCILEVDEINLFGMLRMVRKSTLAVLGSDDNVAR
tara:strand:+ start:1545 stop:1682 length:138 start_codon:yes stop_codon:yes gene_type:complete